MKPTHHPRVKICCIRTLEEAWMAIDLGAAALGLVSEMPSGPGVIDEARIAEIAAALPPTVSSFLLTSKQETGALIAQQRRTATNTLQICDRLLTGSYSDLRQALPGIAVVQVIHVRGEEAIAEALKVASNVDALLLDSGKPSLTVRQLGGTGRRHDWQLSRRIRERVNVPVFLAGGLNAENVREAIEQVGPFGLDVCTGVRTDGHLDAAKLERFFKRVRELEVFLG